MLFSYINKKLNINGSLNFKNKMYKEKSKTVISKDIDECATNDHDCDVTKLRVCSNLPGKYECVCQQGYAENKNGNCTSRINFFSYITL